MWGWFVLENNVFSIKIKPKNQLTKEMKCVTVLLKSYSKIFNFKNIYKIIKSTIIKALKMIFIMFKLISWKSLTEVKDKKEET